MLSIGDVEKISGIKSYTLRYWESVIPGFTPQKDIGGRRDYSQSELEKVLRLKYLIYEKKLTIEEARNQIILDAEKIEQNSSIFTELKKIRRDLLILYKQSIRN